MSDVVEVRLAASEIANEVGRGAETKKVAELAYECLVRFEPEIGGPFNVPVVGFTTDRRHPSWPSRRSIPRQNRDSDVRIANLAPR